MTAFNTIIFDCDGTLVDSEMLNIQACTDTLIKHGVTAYSLHDVIVRFGGMTMANISKIVLAEQGITLPESFVTDFVEQARANKAGALVAIDGALPAAEELARFFKTCVASNGERSLVFESLHMTKFDALFDETRVFTRIQVAQGKPAPDLFLFAAAKMNSAPAECIVIEDSPTGVLGGVAAGMHVIGFTGSAHDPQDMTMKLRMAGAQVVLASWGEILHYIKGLTAQKMAL